MTRRRDAIVTIWWTWDHLARIDAAVARAYPGRRGMRARFLRRLLSTALRDYEQRGSPPFLPPP